MKSSKKKLISVLVIIAMVVTLFVTAGRGIRNIIDENIPLDGSVLVKETDADKNVIPDKYNTGCSGELEKINFVDTKANLNGINFMEGTGHYGDTCILDYNRNTSLSGKVEFESIDFSDYVFTIYRAEKFSDKVECVFKNCKFSTFLGFYVGEGTNISFKFENCSFEFYSGSNATFNKCYFGNSYQDGIRPFQNVAVENSFFGKFESSDTSGEGYHTDGTQIFGRDDAVAKNISFKNCRFECPYLGAGSTAKINACVMIQLEYNDADGILVDNCILNGGGYTIYAWDKNKGWTLNNVELKNLSVGAAYLYGVTYFTISDEVKFENLSGTKSLYVGSVWKDNKGIHISVSNDTAIDRELTVITEKGKKTYTIEACPCGDELGNVSEYDQFPFDKEIIISDSNEYIVCYDTTDKSNVEQIRFVNYNGKDVYVESVSQESSENDNILETGKCGKDVEYKLYNSGKIVLSGTGKTDDYHSQKLAPWYSTYRYMINEVEVKEGVTAVGNQLFNGCSFVSKVKLPKGLERIGSRAFAGCGMLTEIFIPQSVSNIGNAAFYKSIIQNTMYEGNEQEWNKIVIEDNNKCILSNINYNVKAEEETDASQIIDEGACGKAVNYTLSEDGVLELSGEGATYNYNSTKLSPWSDNKDMIKEVVVEDGITVLGSQLFCKYPNLEEITLSNTIETIGSNCFIRCKSLSEIVIPSSVTTIGKYAFWGTNIDSVTYQGSEEDWNNININLYNTPIENNITYLGE